MMKTALFIFVSTLLLAGNSFAKAEYMNGISATPNSCNTCHTAGGGSPRNVFGTDVNTHLSGTMIDWSALCALDSDGDGATNGAELGDPCCTWKAGEAKLTAKGDPADAENKGADTCVQDEVDAGSMPAADAGKSNDSGDDGDLNNSGCDCDSSQTSSNFLMFGFFALFAFVTRRKK